MNKETYKKYIKNVRKIMESEVEQAEVLIAAKGFAQEMQSMIEKVGRLQNEDLGPVVDQMRETYGNEIADSFNNQLDTSLQGILDNMKETQQVMNNAVNDIAQGKLPSDVGVDMDDDMGMKPDLGPESDPMSMPDDGGLDDLDSALDMGDDFEGDVAAAGPEDEPLGRTKKESVQHLKSRIAEAKRLMNALNKAKQQ
jgi:hypothetical protein